LRKKRSTYPFFQSPESERATDAEDPEGEERKGKEKNTLLQI
jgi:hypothetical protein